MPEPVPTRSPSASESPRMSHKNKSSTSKTKGAIRAKSGCYTCRIRRKKCDEKPDSEGNCQTCVRLRLQCLGFGAKRPDWMREGNSVVQLREKIKTFLASQGMIKGHSGATGSSGRAQSSSDQGEGPTSPVVSGPALSSTLPAAHGSGPQNSAVLQLNDLRGSPPGRSLSISPNGSHASGGYTGVSYARSGQPMRVFTNVDGAYGPHSPHSRRSPSPYSSVGAVDLLGSDDLLHLPGSGSPSSYGSSGAGAGSGAFSGAGAGTGPFSAHGHAHAPSHPRIYTADGRVGVVGVDVDYDYDDYYSPSYDGYSHAFVHPVAHHSPSLRNPQLSPDSPKLPHRQMPDVMLSPHGQYSHFGQMGTPHNGQLGLQSPQVIWNNNALGASNHQPSYFNPPRFTHHNHRNGARGLTPWTAHQTHPAVAPQVQSQFGTLYNTEVYDAEADQEMADESELQPYDDTRGAVGAHGANDAAVVSYYGLRGAPIHPFGDPYYAGDHLVSHYLQFVRPVQYFFADPDIDAQIWNLANNFPSVLESLRFVASVHRKRMHDHDPARIEAPRTGRRADVLTLRTMARPIEVDDEGVAASYDRMKKDLLSRSDRGQSLTLGDAMAGLQCVSSFLFNGGAGEWDAFLGVACAWVSSLLESTRGRTYGEKLYSIASHDRMAAFIIKATMWFEVLASITEARDPRFLPVYRDVFAPSRFQDLNGSNPYNQDNGFSMLSVMGCDNITFLAIAEISAFASWKDRQIKDGRLSVLELVKRGSQIEEKYLLQERSMDMTDPILHANSSYPSAHPASSTMDMPDDSLETRRALTADIFRASARLYLHTVLSGDKPSVDEIMDGVKDTIDALRRVPQEPSSLRRSVVRSVVFPICLAGCMTDNEEYREFLTKLLKKEGGAGNCMEVVKVMETVWEVRGKRRRQAKHAVGGTEDVSWRDVLREHGLPLLLV